MPTRAVAPLAFTFQRLYDLASMTPRP